MKEKSNATLRRAASLRCRTDAAIERLGRNISCYERGYITAGELLREASDAADRAGNLELSEAELAATDSFGRSVNRKVKAYRGYARTAARIAMGFKSDAVCRRKALELAHTAVRLGLVFRKLRDNLVEIDRNFILELGSLYLCLATQLEIRKLQKILAEEK